MRVLVSSVAYPDPNGGLSLMYVHTRNRYYVSQGIDVTVLNFVAKENYTVDGIPVITLDSYKNNPEKYDVFVAHAAQIDSHYPFLKEYGKRFSHYIFFFHGYEVLRINKVYPRPYPYIQTNPLKRAYQYMYDEIHDFRKFHIWHDFFIRNVEKTHFVFVSKWMLDEFLKWTKMPFDVIRDRYMITYNCVGKPFEIANYSLDCAKKYDFLTIRSNLDGSKYCVDIVNDLAKSNPDLRFVVVGKGDFFKYNKKADNLMWLNQGMNHDEIVEIIQQSRCALMPTRTDAQGLMMCEMATTGIPTITSDIPVCHEIFDDFKNVLFIDNNNTGISLEPILGNLESEVPYVKNEKYFNDNTSQKEVELLQMLFEQGGEK